MVMIVICLFMEKKSLCLKPMIKMLTFRLSSLRSTSNGSGAFESRELSLKGISIDYN